VLVSPISAENGQTTHLLGVADDITEQHRLEEAVRLAQKMEAFGQLAAGVAHDFNNLLQVMVGSVAVLRGAKRDEAGEVSDAIVDIEDAVHGASNLTRQLLTFSRHQPQQLETVDLNVVAGTTAPQLWCTRTAE
jgi:two-component system, cell cycle sensor histidine kinase and response regulator CckA